MGNSETAGKRPTCLAFVISDLSAVSNGVTQYLSVDYLCHHAAKRVPNWKGEGFTTDDMFDAVEKDGQPNEDLYPYSAHDILAPLNPPPVGLKPILYSKFRQLNCSSKNLSSAIDQKGILGIAIAVTQSLFTPGNGLVDYDPLAIVDAYHALILTGYGKHNKTNEIYFKVRILGAKIGE